MPVRLPALSRATLSLVVATGLAGTALPALATGASAATGTIHYTVRAGDTLTRIATSHHSTVKAIAAASHLRSIDDLRVGQVLTIPVPVTTPTPSPKPAPTPSRNLITTQRIGTSVQGRAIMAYLVGDRSATRTEMVIGSMHGDEPAGVTTANAIIDGPAIKGVRIWVVPTMNRDGLNRHTRTNAHGVDLNGNFPDLWRLTSRGRYFSGTKALSEPESRAIYSFVSRVQPQFLVSLHQPFNAVDNERVKSRALQRALSRNLHLQIKWTGKNKTVSHGTMVGSINARIIPTAAITVEFAPSPTQAYLTTTARTGIVRAEGGSY